LDLSPGYPGKFVDIFSPFFLKQKTVAIICIATQKGSVQQELPGAKNMPTLCIVLAQWRWTLVWYMYQ
jgi:hypothetical protein